MFEGRTEEKAWLRARLADKSLSIVWGPPGLGKTGLVLRVVADERAPRVLYCSAIDTPAGDPFLIELGRQLAALASEEVAWQEPRRSRKDLILLTLGLAERARATVVLDDLHAQGDLAEQLLLAISRYARHARFVVMTRTRSHHEELADKTLRLEPLSSADLVRLVRRCAPSRAAAEIDAIAERALGSPFRARRLVLSESGADLGASLVADLDDGAKRAVQALRVLSIAVLVPEDVTRALDRCGLIRCWAGRVRLDDRLRPLLDTEPLDREVALRAALELVRHDAAPAAGFEAVRLAIEAGDAALAEALLDERSSALFMTGYAQELFERLGRLGSPALARHRFACAEWILGGASLAWAMAEPEPADFATRLVWCRLLAHGGAIVKAREVTRDVAERGPAALRRRATLLLADILRHAADADGSAAVLEALVVETPRERVDRDLRLAMALAVRGDLARAADLLEALPRALDGLDASERRIVRCSLATAFLAASRFHDLERLLGDGDAPADCRSPELFAHLALAVERGRFALAQRLLDRIHPFVEDGVHMRFVHGYNAIRVRVCVGATPGLDEIARKLAFDAPSFEYPELAAWSWCAKAAVDVACAPDAPIEELPARLAIPDGPTRWLVEAWRRIFAARRGDATAPPPPTPTMLPPDVGLVVARAEAEARVGRDELEEAERVLATALDHARAQRFAIEEVNLLALLLDVRLLGAARGVTERAYVEIVANDLLRVAERLGSPRFADEARFGSWLLLDRQDPAALFDLAESASSPVVRRRAGRLLGREPALDALDRKIVDSYARGAARREPGALVLDLERRTLALPSGKEVDLSAADLHMRMLEVLIRGGGRATKEELVRGAWELGAYHPHRDDKRLQVAVHRLRQLVEENPREPALLLRDEAGYRLGAPVRLGRSGQDPK